MIFVDTSVLVYAVGGEHPHRSEAREFFRRSIREDLTLVTSSEVLRELLQAYVASDRGETLDAALTLAEGRIARIWSMEEDDVRLARMLAEEFPALDGRDLLHLASCRRREVDRLKTFDRALESAFT
jgi:predicted nucleic acid-binding protein